MQKEEANGAGIECGLKRVDPSKMKRAEVEVIPEASVLISR